MPYSHFDFKYIDIHTHFFPPKIFEAIWKFFEMPDDNGDVKGWPIKYKLQTEELVKFLQNQNVKAFTTLNYAHKKGIAEYLNNWTINFVKRFKNAIPFGCVWPKDENRVEYVKILFEEHNFLGIKVQPLVQNFYLFDKLMDPIYKLIIDYGKWFLVHAGTAPYRNKYVGFKHFIKFYEKYSDMNVIVAHLGAFEYDKFLSLIDKYENIYFDTAMIFIPNNIFRERKIKRPKSEDLILYQDRILYGSDFPNIPYDYQFSTKGFLELNLSKNFYENIFYNNSKKLFLK
ncbi:MAG: amidohydrolase family protein [Promethearchaeota archaeon]